MGFLVPSSSKPWVFGLRCCNLRALTGLSHPLPMISPTRVHADTGNRKGTYFRQKLTAWECGDPWPFGQPWWMPPCPRSTQSSSSCACSPRRPERPLHCGRWQARTSSPSSGFCWTVSWRGSSGPGDALGGPLPPSAQESHVILVPSPSRQEVADLLQP